MYIDFSVTNQTLSRTSNDKTVENSQNYWRCRFNFVSADWGEVTKAAMFKTPDMEKPVIRLLVDNECDFPNGTSRSTCNIALIGGGSEVITALASGTAAVRSGMIVTTNTVCIPFEDTLDSDDVDCDLSLPDNDFTEFLSKLNAKITKIDNLQEQIKVDIDGKVDKVNGKGLSTNDYTDEEKEKLANLPYFEDIEERFQKLDGNIADTQQALDRELVKKQNKLTFDTAPTANSTNPIMSGAVKTALDGKVDTPTDNGAFTVGRNANTIEGIAIGIGATTRRGVAISCEAVAEDDGIAIGEQSLTYGGIAIGHFARTFTYADSGDYIPIDAIQLGEGDNSNPYTMQVYNYQLIACDSSGNKRVNYLKDVGKLSQLTTTVKNSIVDAVNSIVTLLKNKADKYTEDGGFVAGEGASNYVRNAKSGIAIGKTAESENGGVSIGYNSWTGQGVSIGYNSSGNGVTIGKNAHAHTEAGEPIDAVQLGAGENENKYTMQVYDYPLIANDATTKSATDGGKYLKDVGKLSSLQTTEKNNIVGAVNELKTQINALHGFGVDFWTGFFKTGRTDFSYAFINNGAAEIKPTQVINATVIKYMLLNCSELADASPIVVNLSADNPVIVGVCMGCSKMTKPPVINFTSEDAHVCRSYVSAYANCAKLTQCTIWFGDGTQSASGERTDMANTFLNCSALTSLTFSGSGSPKSLDLSACKLLSNESIQSLYNALMDVSTVTSGTYKITINSDIQTKITALSLDFAAKGWTLEVKQEETSNA